jgi:flagellar biosynthesis/type III secretory pathway chaperone
MKVDEWLQFFKQHSTKKLFSVSDLSQLINEPKTSLMVQLTRLTQSKNNHPRRTWLVRKPVFPTNKQKK